jgi:hypothetical protein
MLIHTHTIGEIEREREREKERKKEERERDILVSFLPSLDCPYCVLLSLHL